MKSKLKQSNTALLVIDIQEAFRKSIATLDSVIKSTSIAIKGFDILKCPVIITEQYPKGLGPTVAELTDISGSLKIFEKSKFSSYCGVGVEELLKTSNIGNVVVAGIETHVCVNQTVHDLLDNGFSVHVLEDAVASRKTGDRETALRKMYLNGATPTSVEMVLFELLADSKHPEFRQIQALVK